MQEDCFKIRLADIYGMDLDAAFVGCADHRCENIRRLGCDDGGNFMIDCNGLEHAVQTFERFSQRFGVFIFSDV
jgi:hypothetical protein